MTAARERTEARWLRRFGGPEDPATRLVCFPHAGGSASFFRGWPAFLPSEVELLAVQYPGRQDRISEPLIGEMAVLADRITEAIRPRLDRPTILFGHSLGATVAFEVASRIAKSSALAGLVVSARAAPSLARPHSVYRRDDAGVLAYLRELGGMDSRVLADPELRELALPVVRNDLRIAGTYHYVERPPLDCPITAIAGESDGTFPPEDAAGWAAHTTAGFEHHVLPGDHFYLENAPAAFVGLLAGALAKAR
ncbi:thioesterase II family protein [Amycolatopsis sp. 195334CR]|uniref:thioesterase II family protein n=1 Tax=Amycolatopsis sp. 195334CR TaxID=2814588 RepID=UPI001A8C77BE|nr:alpha/beta fold hydrolase [Amycolatopsis sp. 195334CR]MBN6039799.1 thioesterase [Amycolatopsis sp. 195334CR]